MAKTYGFNRNVQQQAQARAYNPQAMAREIVNGPQAAPEPANGPLRSFRAGALQAAIWVNESLDDQGRVQQYTTVSFERRYKDKNGEWKSTNSLRTNDLPKASVLLMKAYEALVMKEDGEE